MNYLQCDGQRFIWDAKLGFNVKKCIGNRPIWQEDCSAVAWNLESKKWLDQELFVGDIPPTVLFLSMVNTCSRGLSLYIPTDMSYQKFSELIASQMVGLTIEQNHLLEGYVTTGDLAHLDATGTIPSTKQWNKSKSMDSSYFSLIGPNGEVSRTIQHIVENCHKFLKTVD